MALPSTKPLDGPFWYLLDDAGDLTWKPCPKVRGDFYLGWLGQNKAVVGAGQVRMEQGQLTHICTHGTPYYWLQPYEVLPLTSESMRARQVLGADTMILDFSLAGWGFRDQTHPKTRQWADSPIAAGDMEQMLYPTVDIIVRSFRSEGEPIQRPSRRGLLARAETTTPADPLDVLLDLLAEDLGESNVVPVLIELVKYDINVLPSYRVSDFFEQVPVDTESPSRSQLARVVLSAIYHLAPLLGSQRLNNALLLNSLRQRHPFDVTWGADFMLRCFTMPTLVRLLLAALLSERNDQILGNVLDLLQESGYGLSAGMDTDVLNGLSQLRAQDDLGAFGQVVDSHRMFIQEYIRQRDAAQETD
jgi:hypothetical protein